MTWMVAGEVVAWSKAFALTAAIEVPIVVAYYGRTPAPPSTPVRAGLALFAQLASHPSVWFVFPRLGISWIAMVAWAETWAVLSETAFYALTFGARLPAVAGAPPSPRAPWLARAFGVSLLANGASFASGLILRELTGWV